MASPKNIVGPQVSRFRNERGWSQAQLAARCQLAGWNVSRGIVAAIEGRVRWVGDFELMMLARVLKVAVDDLLPAKLDLTLFVGE
ncbi:putative transcriptional regulator [Opitutaceae bacterium TAV1]|nr:putative transcriptional regulator [Opitutaceae bacterium TAV1]